MRDAHKFERMTAFGKALPRIHRRVARDLKLPVGEIAARDAIVLLELRSGGSEGLEEMFLELTADTQREKAAS